MDSLLIQLVFSVIFISTPEDNLLMMSYCDGLMSVDCASIVNISSSPEQEVLMVSYCDSLLSVVCLLSSTIFFLILEATIIIKSSCNLFSLFILLISRPS